MDYKKLFTPKRFDILWMILFIFTSIILSSIYIKFLSSMSFAESFLAVMSGTAFMIMSFAVPNSIVYPILFLLLELLLIRLADYFIEDKRIRIPLLIILVEVLFYFTLRMYI